MVKVLFVCLGNICRSPTAHGIFRHEVEKANLLDRIYIDSAGTGDWHIGHAPDKRAQAAAVDNGYDISDLRARQVVPDDFFEFDYVLGMDAQNLANLKAMAPQDYNGHLSLFLDFLPDQPIREVPDPYYGEEQGFQTVLTMIEEASNNLLNHIRKKHGL